MNNEINVDKLIVVEQLPKIYSQLDELSIAIAEKLKGLNEIECTEENKQDVKKYKTYLNSIKNQLEDKRKEIKKKINEPYEQFNSYYEQSVKTMLENGISQLNEKISVIEQQQLQEKINEIEEFFNKYVEFYHLEKVVESYQQLGLKVNLSSAVSTIKTNVKAMLEDIAKNVEAISKMPNREEILLEFKKNGFDYARAYLEVENRKNELQNITKAMSEQDNVQEKEQETVKSVEELIPEKEEIHEIVFKVRGTKTKLLLLRQFLVDNNIDYE